LKDIQKQTKDPKQPGVVKKDWAVVFGLIRREDTVARSFDIPEEVFEVG
jgi:hypothetical protein